MTEPLLVSELFYSLQGESTRAGLPCLFIRLAGCNLRCRYCDARYTWEEPGEPMTPAAILAWVERFPGVMVELTGGEPLFQAGALPLLEQLVATGRQVLLETNGSLDISAIPAGVTAIMDVKGPSSGESGAMDWSNLERLRPQDEVKFVVADRADFEWAVRLIRDRRLAERCHAVLVGAVAGRLDLAVLAAWLIETRLPARLNLRLHAQLGLR